MVITKLMGGLGNQMFQYAIGRKLSLKLSSELKMDISGFEVYKLHNYSLDCYELENYIKTGSKPIAQAPAWYEAFNKYLPVKFHFGLKTIAETSFPFNSKLLQMQGDIYLDGYWQSEKYFGDIRKILLNDFKIKYDQDKTNKQSSSEIQSCESVSLHIRRGDYVSNAQTLEKHGVCDLEYYYRAVEHIAARVETPSFFIFSDDPDWARENLKINYPVTFVVNNDASTNYEDLRLMSQCMHNIIANSSFSWWGAWLNENPAKIVIAPEEWFMDKAIDTTDVIPETWVSL